MMILVVGVSFQGQDYLSPPQLNGEHFRITAVQENGFLDIQNDDKNGQVTFSGYLVDMMKSISKPERANFTYTLLPPSGTGSACVPRIDHDNVTDGFYHDRYRTQYNCGAADVNDSTIYGNTTPYSTDMYLGMFYVNPTRQLLNHFTVPFLPPFSGTLAVSGRGDLLDHFCRLPLTPCPVFYLPQMFGTATHLDNFTHLVQQQQQQQQPQNTTNAFIGVQVTSETTCGPAGTALIEEVKAAYPGLQIKGIFGGEEEIYEHFYNGSCTVYITDGPIAAQFILRKSRNNKCFDRHKNPIGVIGEPMPFGLSHYAIGIRKDISQQVVNTLSYWMLILMSCNPLDANGACPDGNFASLYEGSGGTGQECGYVAYPEQPADGINPGIIAGIVFGVFFVVLIAMAGWHRYRLRNQRRQFAKQNRDALQRAEKESEFNEFMAHEIRNPLASALAALNFVSSKTADQLVVPDSEQRSLVQGDIRVIDSSLQFINELLRNMLDLHRSSSSTALKLHPVPTDVQKDILDPVASILYMRGASVDIITECNPPNLYIMADRMRLKQILLNLSFNATKFVEKGYIRLRASVVEISGEDKAALNGNVGLPKNAHDPPQPSQQHIELYVEDSGPGIPEHKRQSLFNKWQDSLDVLNQGTGIGLALCKKLSILMSELKRLVRLQSKSNKTYVFFLVLEN
jgi:signal transduction histidine kinase